MTATIEGGGYYVGDTSASFCVSHKAFEIPFADSATCNGPDQYRQVMYKHTIGKGSYQYNFQ